jgi:hypothetical protein
LRGNLSDLEAKVDTKANEQELRKWVTESIEEASKAILEALNEKTDTLDKKIELNQAEMSKYLKEKFDLMQEKQFTIPGLVGEDPKFTYNYLGEYLLEMHDSTKRQLKELDELAKKTAEGLTKVT